MNYAMKMFDEWKIECRIKDWPLVDMSSSLNQLLSWLKFIPCEIIMCVRYPMQILHHSKFKYILVLNMFFIDLKYINWNSNIHHVLLICSTIYECKCDVLGV